MSTRRIRLDLTKSLASLVMLANLFLFCSSYAQAAPKERQRSPIFRLTHLTNFSEWRRQHHRLVRCEVDFAPNRSAKAKRKGLRALLVDRYPGLLVLPAISLVVCS